MVLLQEGYSHELHTAYSLYPQINITKFNRRKYLTHNKYVPLMG
jgi:hypothetical protein